MLKDRQYTDDSSYTNRKTKITFHNGLRTIGGTIIEIIYEDSHIFFDFGSEYNPAAPVQPTDLQGLLDEKLVPYVNNVFDPRIELVGYKSVEDEYKNTAVFLSHVHLDHSKIINYLDPKIPLYTLEGTKSLLDTLNINNDFLFPLQKDSKTNTREIIGVKENEVVSVGDIKVKVMPIDHDAYGACGMLITTPDMSIAYTGDVRFHGYREESTLAFAKECERCDALIIEGVSVSFSDFDDEPKEENASELTVLDSINNIVKQNPNKQLTFNYYIANIERVNNIIKTNPRTVVLSAYAAYVVKMAINEDVYYYNLDNKDYGLDKNYEISFDELLNDESKYFWQLDGKALEYVESLKDGGIYVHSNAAPMIEKDPAYQPFMDRFADNGVEVVKLSCSGHAHPNDLMRLISLIKPKLLVPIHSFRPEMLTNEYGDRLLPEKGQTI